MTDRLRLVYCCIQVTIRVRARWRFTVPTAKNACTHLIDVMDRTTVATTVMSRTAVSVSFVTHGVVYLTL